LLAIGYSSGWNDPADGRGRVWAVGGGSDPADGGSRPRFRTEDTELTEGRWDTPDRAQRLGLRRPSSALPPRPVPSVTTEGPRILPMGWNGSRCQPQRNTRITKQTQSFAFFAILFGQGSAVVPKPKGPADFTDFADGLKGNRRFRRLTQMGQPHARGARTLLSASSGGQPLEPRIARMARRGTARAAPFQHQPVLNR
jgi:hypothetical protein